MRNFKKASVIYGYGRPPAIRHVNSHKFEISLSQ